MSFRDCVAALRHIRARVSRRFPLEVKFIVVTKVYFAFDHDESTVETAVRIKETLAINRIFERFGKAVDIDSRVLFKRQITRDNERNIAEADVFKRKRIVVSSP